MQAAIGGWSPGQSCTDSMLATAHIIAGAAVGKTLRPAWVALPVAFGSHFLLDNIPHLDSHALFGAPDRITRPEAIMALADVLVGSALVLWAVWRQQGRGVMLLAALLASVIDLVDNVPPYSGWFRGCAATSWLSAFHHGFQANLPPAQWPLGFSTQAAVVAIALWAVRFRKQPRPTAL